MKYIKYFLISLLALNIIACGAYVNQTNTLGDNSNQLKLIEGIQAIEDDPMDQPIYKSNKEICEEGGGNWRGDCLEYDPDDEFRCVTYSANKGRCWYNMGSDRILK